VRDFHLSSSFSSSDSVGCLTKSGFDCQPFAQAESGHEDDEGHESKLFCPILRIILLVLTSSLDRKSFGQLEHKLRQP
jgi:hypothetical protein